MITRGLIGTTGLGIVVYDYKALTISECYDQLATYASRGNGTHINQLFRKQLKEEGHYRHPFPTLTISEKDIELLETIDCNDAGSPTEIERCQSIKTGLVEIYFIFQKSVASDRLKHNADSITNLRNSYEKNNY